MKSNKEVYQFKARYIYDLCLQYNYSMLFHDLSKYLHRLTLHSGFTCCIIKIFVHSVYYSFAPNRFMDYLKEKKKMRL